MPDPEPNGKVSFGIVKLEGVPKWALAGATLLAVVVGAWLLLSPAQKELISQKQATEAAQALVDEYGRHIAETPGAPVTLMDDIRGKITAQVYGRDKCTLLIWTPPDGSPPWSRLILDPARDQHRQAGHPFDIIETPVAASSVAGRCLAAHPGVPKQWYGERLNECQMWVYRSWQDGPNGTSGCLQRQLFDACHASFGPLTWLNCVH